MAAPRELELKLERVGANGFPAAKYGKLLGAKELRTKTEQLDSVYFDTDELKLRKGGVSLRVRSSENRHLQTIKKVGRPSEVAFDRDEWESEVEGNLPDFKSAKGTALEHVLSKRVRRALKPVFETRVRRTTFQVDRKNSEIEVSIDRGRIKARGQATPLNEIELELKRGEPAALYQLARELANGDSVGLAVKSKAERGYDLLTREPPAAVKSAPINLAADCDTKGAFIAIGRACLAQLLANVPALRAGDAEGVHQARVSLRRLRAAISLFSEMLQDEQTDEIKRQLKWLTGELAPARELDVLVKSFQDSGQQRHGVGSVAFAHTLKRRKRDALRRVKSIPDGTKFRILALEVAAWIETGSWTVADDPLRSAIRNQSAATSAAERLNRVWKKIIKRGRRLDSLSARKRHKLRIAAKKLRYGTDFFCGLFPEKTTARRRKQLVNRLRRLQDCLGELNDVVAHEEMAARLARRKSVAGNRGRWVSFNAGQIFGREECRAPGLLRSAMQAYRSFSECKRYWNE